MDGPKIAACETASGSVLSSIPQSQAKILRFIMLGQTLATRLTPQIP